MDQATKDNLAALAKAVSDAIAALVVDPVPAATLQQQVTDLQNQITATNLTMQSMQSKLDMAKAGAQSIVNALA